MVCKCSHGDNEHAFDDPTVCKVIGCKCIEFRVALEEGSVFLKHVMYLNQMIETEDKIRYLLTNMKYLRDFSNKDFVFAYWIFCDGLIIGKPLVKEGIRNLTDPETIRRAKQKLVASNRETYGEISEDVLLEKAEKQMGILEYAVSK